MFSYEKPRKNACQFNGFQLMLYILLKLFFVQDFDIAQSVARLVCTFLCNECRRVWGMGSSLKIVFEHFFTIFIFIQFKCPFQDYFTHRDEPIDRWGETGVPRDNHLTHPQAELGLSHMWPVRG